MDFIFLDDESMMVMNLENFRSSSAAISLFPIFKLPYHSAIESVTKSRVIPSIFNIVAVMAIFTRKKRQLYEAIMKIIAYTIYIYIINNSVNLMKVYRKTIYNYQ